MVRDRKIEKKKVNSKRGHGSKVKINYKKLGSVDKESIKYIHGHFLLKHKHFPFHGTHQGTCRGGKGKVINCQDCWVIGRCVQVSSYKEAYGGIVVVVVEGLLKKSPVQGGFIAFEFYKTHKVAIGLSLKN